MDSRKKIHIFAHSDLDGAASYILMHWYLWNNPSYTITNHENLKNNVNRWLLKNDITKYDEVYFLALDTCEIVNLIDYSNVKIFDHHQEAERCKDMYKNASVEILTYGSTVLGLFKYFKEKKKDRKITLDQRRFIALVDDYISYRLLERDKSIGINMIFWNYQGDKFQKLKNDFNNGFVDFDENQQSTIKFYRNKINKILDNGEFFIGDFKIQGVFRKVIATFADTCVNEIAYGLTEMGFEIAMIVNVATKKVSFRKNQNSNVNLPKLAKTLLDGGGYNNAAGGVLTDKFMEFTKLLKRYDVRKRTTGKKTYF
jgi:oligoribonuclease NrnB/cAMP/cGMP phosphodiesterase (DHH superfamily)